MRWEVEDAVLKKSKMPLTPKAKFGVLGTGFLRFVLRRSFSREGARCSCGNSLEKKGTSLESGSHGGNRVPQKRAQRAKGKLEDPIPAFSDGGPGNSFRTTPVSYKFLDLRPRLNPTRRSKLH